MNKIKNLTIILILSTFFLSFLYCDIFSDEDIEINGTWLDENAYGKQKLIITNYKFTNYWQDSGSDEWDLYWEGNIYNYDNDIWNTEEVGSGDYGYLVVKYSSPSEYHPEAEDKYMVVRWKLFNGDSMEWSEGFKFDSESDAGDCGVPGVVCGIYFDSILDAEEGATGSEGFFGMFSSISKYETE